MDHCPLFPGPPNTGSTGLKRREPQFRIHCSFFNFKQQATKKILGMTSKICYCSPEYLSSSHNLQDLGEDITLLYFLCTERWNGHTDPDMLAPAASPQDIYFWGLEAIASFVSLSNISTALTSYYNHSSHAAMQCLDSRVMAKDAASLGT